MVEGAMFTKSPVRSSGLSRYHTDEGPLNIRIDTNQDNGWFGIETLKQTDRGLLFVPVRVFRGQRFKSFAGMAEKAVDETPALGGMNVFNAVTSIVHPLPSKKSSAGRSVTIGRRTESADTMNGGAVA
jgi:hypothetical protein